jgi:regulator of RNase E activity RraA
MSDSLPAIRRDIVRVDADLVRRASTFQAAILADVAGRRGALDGRIAPLARSMKVAGPAFTVEVRPGDNLMFHVALALAQPGDVIVVDGKGDRASALCGAIMVAQARAKGIAGFVVDAAARDADELGQGSFPVFSVGTNPNGPTKGLGGRVNWPIAVGGVAVSPGDLVVGDADGVTVVARENVPEVLVLAQQKVDAEAKRMREIANGNLGAPWLVDALRVAGVLGKDETL